MIRTFRDTSIEAYRKVLPSLSARQRFVLGAFLDGPKTNRMVSKLLDLPINEVTPRVYELRAKKVLVEVGSVKCSWTKKRVHLWGILEYQPSLF